MMKMFLPLLIAIVFTLQSLYPVSSAECGSKRSSCMVGTFNESQLRDSFSVSVVTPNLTVYTGQSAVFLFKITTTESGLTPTAYVDDCEDDTHCILTEQQLERTCTFNNVNASDNGKEIYFYVLFNKLKPIPGLLCHDPPSYLTVLGPPSSIGIIYSINPSTGLHVSLNSTLPPNTNVTLSLLMDSLPLSVTVLTSSHGNDITYPPSLLTNHTGIYTIMSTPTNPAGDGPPTTVTVDLYNDANYTLYYSLDNAKVQTSSSFIGVLDIQVDMSRPLTIPNWFHASSSCSDEAVTEHQVNMTHLHVLDQPMVTITVPLIHGRRNCSFNVMDELGNMQNIDTGQSTFYTTSYDMKDDHDSFDITCQFIDGSIVNGCNIIVLDKHNNKTKEKLIPLAYSNNDTATDTVTLGPFTPGVYHVLIYDYYNGRYDESNPVFTFVFEAVQMTPSPIITNTAISTVSTSLVSPSCSSSICSELPTEKSVNNHYYMAIIGVGSVIGAVLLLLIVVLVVVIVFKRRQHRIGEYIPGPDHDRSLKKDMEVEPVKRSLSSIEESPESPSIDNLYDVVANTASEDKESNSSTNDTDLKVLRPSQADSQDNNTSSSIVLAGNYDIRNHHRPNELKRLVPGGIGSATNKHNHFVETSETTFDSTKENEELSPPVFNISPTPSPVSLDPPQFDYSRQNSNASTIVPVDEYSDVKPAMISDSVMFYGPSRRSSIQLRVRKDSIATLEDTTGDAQEFVLTRQMSSHPSNPLFKVNDESDEYMTKNQSKIIQDSSGMDGTSSTYVGNSRTVDSTTTTGGTDSSLMGEQDKLIRKK